MSEQNEVVQGFKVQIAPEHITPDYIEVIELFLRNYPAIAEWLTSVEAVPADIISIDMQHSPVMTYKGWQFGPLHDIRVVLKDEKGVGSFTLSPAQNIED